MKQNLIVSGYLSKTLKTMAIAFFLTKTLAMESNLKNKQGQIASEVESGDPPEQIKGEAYLEVVGGEVLAELVGDEEEHRSVIVEVL